MKKKDFQNLKDKSIDALKTDLSGKKKEAVLTYSKIKSGQEKNTSIVRNLKREIAKILTLIKEKEIINKEAETGIQSKTKEEKSK